MLYSKLIPKTRREDPKDASSPGSKLLIRAGFIDQISRGIWIMTTLGLKVRRKVENIIRQEMNRINAIELELPILQPKEYWEETGRWDKYAKGQIAFMLKDRKNSDYILAPTAEEIVTHFARANLNTIRDLPLTLWQMSPKFRDELRPRQGLIRGREFLMKDAYSFDKDEEGMQLSYQNMDNAYHEIFSRCGFNFIKVEADSGAIGGSGSAEFMAITEYGEDVLLYCSKCGYGGNQEKAIAYLPEPLEIDFRELKMIETPNIKTVEQLEHFFNMPASQMVKTIVLVYDGKPLIVSMRGDLEISEVKLANLLKANNVETATPEIVREVTGAPVGFAGPINLFGKTNTPYYFDKSVRGLRNFLCGGNASDVHYINVNPERDFPVINEFYDLSKVVSGQFCSNCKTGILEEKKGIELGHIFQLQQIYSTPMQATFTDQKGSKIPFWMGCYGIGVSRIVQSIVEQNYDSRGIIWPTSLTPFNVVIIPINLNEHLNTAIELYKKLNSEGFDVLLDERDVRIGEKLTDAELQGWPFQIIVGRSWTSEKKFEVHCRDENNYNKSIFTKQNASLPIAFMSNEEILIFLKNSVKQF